MLPADISSRQLARLSTALGGIFMGTILQVGRGAMGELACFRRAPQNTTPSPQESHWSPSVHPGSGQSANAGGVCLQWVLRRLLTPPPPKNLPASRPRAAKGKEGKSERANRTGSQQKKLAAGACSKDKPRLGKGRNRRLYSDGFYDVYFLKFFCFSLNTFCHGTAPDSQGKWIPERLSIVTELVSWPGMDLFSGLIASSVLLMPSYLLCCLSSFFLFLNFCLLFCRLFTFFLSFGQLIKLHTERYAMIRDSCGELNKGIGNTKRTEERPAIGGQELGRRLTKAGQIGRQWPDCE